jgi:excisionase family DNA binding protein
VSSEESELEKPYLTPTEAAALLMVAPVTLRAWAAKGLLRAQATAGGHRRFLRRDLERFARDRGLRLSDRIPESNEMRVLIVDDDHLFADFLVEFLTGRGAQAVAVYDGFAAGRRVESFAPDVVLLDLMMPGMNGVEVCRQLKVEKTTRHIRVLAMTGYADGAEKSAVLDAGAEICVAKPLDYERLLSLVGLQAQQPAALTAE